MTNPSRFLSRVCVPQGVGRRYAHVVLRKADIDLTKRAGELTEDEVRGLGGDRDVSWGLGDISRGAWGCV